MNRMADVATMFGKKIGEEFNLNDGVRNLKCKITDEGLLFYASAYNQWWYDSGALVDLLTGKAVVVDEDRR